MKKQTLEPSLFPRDSAGKKVRVGFLTPALIVSLFFLGCRGKDDPAVPVLPADVTNISKNTALSIAPHAAASGDRVYVAWTDQNGNQDFEILLSRSSNGGIDFSEPLNISQSIASSQNPRMALSGNSLYLVWEEFIPEKNESDILFRKADDQGGTLVWTPPLHEPGKNLSASATACRDDSRPTTPAPCPSQFPDIAVEAGRLFVAWAEENHYIITPIAAGLTATEFKIINSDIQMVTSQDGGDQFTAPFNVSGPKTGAICGTGRTETASFSPTLAAENGRLYLSWEDCIRPNAKILFRRFPDQSNVAPPSQEPTVLSDPAKNASKPSLAAEGDQVHVVWEEFFSNEISPNQFCVNTEVFFTTSIQQGIDFSGANRPAVLNLSNTPCGFNSNTAKLAISGASVYIAWADNSPGVTGIPFRKSADSGVTFGAAGNLSQTAGSAFNPAVAAIGNILFSFWEDSTLGNLEILFARR
jgi:hypothetical protein